METITPEVMPEENKLALVAQQVGLAAEEAKSLETAFAPLFREAEEWRSQAEAIVVTDATQTQKMKLARSVRLGLKEIRVNVEKKRMELKASALLRGKAIDGMANVLKFLIEPLEAHLLQQEQFAERLETKRKAELTAIRSEQLTALGANPTLYVLGEMTDETWQQLVKGIRLAKEQAVEATRKADEEREAREHAELVARVQQRREMERLKKEAAEKDAALKVEREKAEAELRRQAEIARKEREAAAVEAARIKAESDKAAKIAAEQARKERAAIEAKAKTEREAREKAEAALRAQKEAQETKEAAERAAAAKAAAAPDREKILAYAAAVRALPIPECATLNGQSAANTLASQMAMCSKWIEDLANKL